MTLEEFYVKYPKQSMEVNKKNFEYRYYKKDGALATLALLTGGIGLSDLFYQHFDRFTQDFSVITFDYLECYETMAEFADAVAVLLEKLEVKAWLVGQSLGGITAQIIAKRHPNVIDGLVLSNTASLAKSLDGEGLECLQSMVARQKKSRKLIRIIPFGIAKKFMLKTVKKKMEQLPEETCGTMNELVGIMMGMLTKKYELHMIDMLTDCENHLVMEQSDFKQLNDKVLLVLAEDDPTFNEGVKQSLINLMPQPTVITDLGGGHLGALMQLERYAAVVTDYIFKRV